MRQCICTLRYCFNSLLFCNYVCIFLVALFQNQVDPYYVLLLVDSILWSFLLLLRNCILTPVLLLHSRYVCVRQMHWFFCLWFCNFTWILLSNYVMRENNWLQCYGQFQTPSLANTHSFSHVYRFYIWSVINFSFGTVLSALFHCFFSSI